ncbi:keto-hydroxyglutarate-aldolase/keto-deoxy-phosphogluconate aldolase [Adhaeretor mobilis]|uniref:Keto-hydroxyglutarate-aldolase/keto-deoxy-phosphogluconate aldolase n=2 Tax=Adhaeretor mobilis TaxID=1930276 RepID=A0A517MW67_9BACT|nr:keto-hydroxyglutarate-aldolase/keto-deoxy-phosphogluconate aldolase [Adhaeretor mobilis]
MVLAEAAAQAGAKVVELTCRRARIREELFQIRKELPELLVMVGSVVDEGPLMDSLKRRRPSMPSIDELIDLGAHGFVSAMPISSATLARVSQTHLFIPGVETPTEMVRVLESGAHFAKLYNTIPLGEHLRVELLTGPALHRLMPLMITAGISRDKIEAYVKAGAAILGSGWKFILGDSHDELEERPDIPKIAKEMRLTLDEMSAARAKHQPMPLDGSLDEYLQAIPHYHPFEELQL